MQKPSNDNYNSNYEFLQYLFAHIYVYTYMFISINHLSIQCYNNIIQNNMLLLQNISKYTICGKPWEKSIV
jgi:hypothetical protein